MVKPVAKFLIGLLLATALPPVDANSVAQNTSLPDVSDPIFSDGFEAIASAGSIVINEVDYVQPGTDGAEYIELYNPGADSVSLAGLTLQLIDGANNSPYAEIELDPVSLAAGAFYVVCDNPVRVPLCDQQVDLTVPWIQDGNPDGVALSGPAGLIDALSYGAASMRRGWRAPAVPPPMIQGPEASAWVVFRMDQTAMTTIPIFAWAASHRVGLTLKPRWTVRLSPSAARLAA